MSVPLVQGSLRYAYKVAELQGGSKEFAEGAAFSAAILPRINACDASAAKVISDNMNMEIAEGDRMKAGFEAVKTAFESTYECLGINCAQIGGLILTGTEYYEGFSPCGKVSAPAPEPEPAPAPAPSGGDHDGHDHDDHDDHDDATTAAPAAATTTPATASGSIRMQSGSALVIGVLLLAYVGVLP
jgi:hypothetical protein